MSPLSLDRLGAAAVFAVVVVVLAIGAARGAVARARVERFARRQGLPVTVNNGAQVVRYLATTRRWRTAGAVGGILASLAGNLYDDRVSFHPVALFVGWFAGTLVAEVRVAHLSVGPRRAASLWPRVPTAYLPRLAWWLMPLAVGVSVVVAAGTAIMLALDRAAPDWTAVLWPAAVVAVAVAVRTIQRHVLRRPQPLAEVDVIAADDAIRSRSLHVLSGGGAALILLCVYAQMGAAHPTGADVDNATELIRGVGVFVAAGIGWNVATWPWKPRHDRHAATAIAEAR